MSDIDTGVVDSLKALDPDGRLEKRTNSRGRGMSALCQSRPNAPQQKAPLFDQFVVVSSDGGEAPACSGIGVVGSTLRHRAGRDGHSEHLSDGRIVKPVLHFADGPSSGSCVTSGDIVLCKGPGTITLFSAFQDIFSRSEGRGGK